MIGAEIIQTQPQQAQPYLDIVEAIIVALNTQQEVILINRKGCDVLGYSQEAIIGKNWFDHFVPAAIRESVRDLFHQFIAGDLQTAESVTNPILTKDGQQRLIAWHNSVITNDAGAVVGTFSSGNDITESHRREIALQESESLYRTLFESSPIGLGVADMAGNLLYFNDAILHPGGYSREDIEAVDNVNALYADPAERQQVLTLFQQQGYVDQHEVRFKRKDGTHYDTLLSLKRIQYQGKPAILSSVVDISLRKQALRQLEQRQHELHVLLKTSRDLVNHLDLNQLLARIVEQSATLLETDNCTLFRLQPDGITLQPVFSTGAYAAERLQVSLRYGEGLTGRSVALNQPLLANNAHKDPRAVQTGPGTDDPEHVMVAPLTFHNQITGAMLISRLNGRLFTPQELELFTGFAWQAATAIENARLYEEVQRHNQELEQRVAERTAELASANQRLHVLSQMKDQFVANVSHELRTPITNLKLYHKLLRVRPENQERYLTTLDHETNRLENLIENLLLLSRLDQDRTVLTIAPVDLNALIGRFVTDRRRWVEEQNLTLTVQTEPSLPTVTADADLLDMVLSILLTNACHYTPGGGQITVAARQREGENGRWVGFAVQDSGPGILPDEIPHLFQRFFRGQAAQKSQTAGTGLGLSIAQEIIKRHQGTIAVQSDPATTPGATFTVWLPATTESDK